MQYCIHRLCRCHSGRDRVVCGAVRGGRKSDRYGRLAVSSGAQNSSLGAETRRKAPSTDQRLTLRHSHSCRWRVYYRDQGPDFRKILQQTYEKLMKKCDLRKT